MREEEYEEIISYIIEQLNKIEANTVIQQIKELESLKILYKEKIAKRGKIEEDISDSITRQMTYKEMFYATLEILEKYLVTVPIMATKLTDLFDKQSGDQSNTILWAVEGNKKFDQIRKETSLESIKILNIEEASKIKKTLDKLKAC